MDFIPNDFISKMAKYIAFLYRELTVWKAETNRQDMITLLVDKIEACRDICTMFECRTEVWVEAKKIYGGVEK